MLITKVLTAFLHRGELNETRNYAVGAFYLEVIINTFAADDKRPALIASPFRNRCI